MATIFFSMAGEGRGHATRVRAVVEQLRHEHRIVLFAPNVAFQMLAEAYADRDEDANIHVRRIAGLQFAYRKGRLDYAKSLWQSMPYIRRLGRHIKELRQAIDDEQPDLLITDFEPLLPRAARQAGLPFISFDHQHFLTTYDLSSLPVSLQWKAWWMGRFVDAYYSGQKHSIVSSFYFPPLKPNVRNVTQVGVLLRPGILEARPAEGEHVLVYLRRFAPDNVMKALRDCGRPVRVYGLGERPQEGNLSFLPVDEDGFVRDLARCHALLSNAGNQLVGEAMYLRKPVLALPETGNFEQAVNAHFLRASQAGDWLQCEDVSPQSFGEFLERVPEFRRQIHPEHVRGNEQALAAIEAHLPGPRDTIFPQPVTLVA